MKNKKYIHQDLIMAIALMVVGIAFFIGSFTLPRYDNPVNNIHVFPLFASTMLMIFSVYNIYAGIKKSKELNAKIAAGEDVVPEISWQKLKYPMTAIFFILIYVICVALLGFFVSSFVFMIAFGYWLGYKKVWVLALTAFGMELFIWVLFVHFLYTRLPNGILF